MHLSGRVDLPIESPDQVEVIICGLQQRLIRDGAADLRREGLRIYFKGDWMRAFFDRGKLLKMANLAWAELEFEPGPAVLTASFRVSYGWFWRAFFWGVSVACAVGGLGVFGLLTLPLVFVFDRAITWLRIYEFRWYLRLAATRALGDHAEAMLTEKT